MKFTVEREKLLKPLQLVAGVVEKRHTLPVLANVLLKQNKENLVLVGTDLDIELQSKIQVNNSLMPGDITVPAYRFVDICRALPENALLDIEVDGKKMIIRSDKSRFSLVTLPAIDFPDYEKKSAEFEFTVPQYSLRKVIEETSFAIAQQDVRYYLNGMLWEVGEGYLRTVSTDGHRMALSNTAVKAKGFFQFIVPQKSVFELQKILSDNEQEEVVIRFSANQLNVVISNHEFTSRLIDGQFPNYNKVIPTTGDNILEVDRDVLKQALIHVSTISNDKHHGVRLELQKNRVLVSATNTEFEHAEEDFMANYNGIEMSVAFNVNYLLDVVNVMPTGPIKITLSNPDLGVRIEKPEGGNSVYVISPMRL